MSELMPVKFLDLNEGDDPKSLPPGTMLLNRNCRMDKGRRLAKRMGTDPLGTGIVGGGNVTVGQRLITRGKDVGIFDGEKVYARVNSLSSWQPLDRPPNLNVVKQEIIDSVRSVLALDVAAYGDWLIMVYATGWNWTGSLFCEIRNMVTRDVVMPPQLITSTSAWSPRIAISGTTAYFIYGTNGNINFQSLDLTTLALGAGGSILSDSLVQSGSTPTPDNGGSEGSIDIAYGTPSGGVPTLWLAYENNGVAVTTDRFTVVRCDLNGVFGNIVTKRYTGKFLTSVAIEFCAAAQKIVAVYADCAATGGVNFVRAITIDPNVSSNSAGPTTIASWNTGGNPTRASRVTVAEYDATNVLIGYDSDRKATTDLNYIVTGKYTIAARTLVANSGRKTNNTRSFCKPFSLGGRWYASALAMVRLGTLSNIPVTPSRVIVEIETANSLTGVSNGTHPHAATLGNQTSWFSPMVTRTVVDSVGTRYVLCPHRNVEPTNDLDPIGYGWDLYSVAVDTSARSAILGSGALCSGGAPFWCDGVTAMPYGFEDQPLIRSVTNATTTSAAMVAGLYSYVVVYEWIDANGVLQRSIPSVPATGTVTNNSLTLLISTASLSSKVRTRLGTGGANPVMLAIYRTTVGGTGPHYRLTRVPVTGVLINDPQATDVTYVDISADANIGTGATPTIALASQAQLYTDLGELADVPPPAFSTVVTHAGRFAGVGSRSTTVWLSKDGRLDQTIAPGFNEALQLTFAHQVRALASLDEKLVVFGEDVISVVHGDGPDDKGQQNTWQVQALQTDVGCIEPRSTVVSPLGVMFQSRRGIELLDRGLGITWVGTAITDSLSSYPTITSAVLVASESEIRFTCTNTAGTHGLMLVWDYMYKTWFTRSYQNAAGTDLIPFADAALIDGVYTLLGVDGVVYQETSAHFLDADAHFVVRDVKLAPISPAGSGLGWYRVKDVSILGSTPAGMNHLLEVSVAHDYATGWEQVETFAAGTPPTIANPNNIGRVQFATQKCQAVQIRIRDLASSYPYLFLTGEGPLFEGLAFRVDTKQGPARISDGGQK